MMIEKGELATFVKKKVKMKFINLDNAGTDNYFTDCFYFWRIS